MGSFSCGPGFRPISEREQRLLHFHDKGLISNHPHANPSYEPRTFLIQIVRRTFVAKVSLRSIYSYRSTIYVLARDRQRHPASCPGTFRAPEGIRIETSPRHALCTSAMSYLFRARRPIGTAAAVGAFWVRAARRPLWDLLSFRMVVMASTSA